MQRQAAVLLMLRESLSRKSAETAPHDRRREERISLELPIEVSGFDCSGRFQSEKTSTQNVASSSCDFHLRMEVEEGMVLAIRMISAPETRLSNLGTVLFYVARVNRVPGGYCVDAVKLAPRAPWSAEILKAKSLQGFLF